MIPIDESVLIPIDIKIYKGDSPSVQKRKLYLTKQLDWCQKNEASILSHAERTYTLVTRYPDKNRNLCRRCCDFKKLETVLEKWKAKNGNDF